MRVQDSWYLIILFSYSLSLHFTHLALGRALVYLIFTKLQQLIPIRDFKTIHIDTIWSRAPSSIQRHDCKATHKHTAFFKAT
ncbi:hypothetical protein EDC01DRAFT_380963 [Geopyxis carbonaria]|nr:hypothetical protein EDC01DRAFT_380963 [Geopyxis carbonaria]